MRLDRHTISLNYIPCHTMYIDWYTYLNLTDARKNEYRQTMSWRVRKKKGLPVRSGLSTIPRAPLNALETHSYSLNCCSRGNVVATPRNQRNGSGTGRSMQEAEENVICLYERFVPHILGCFPSS